MKRKLLIPLSIVLLVATCSSIWKFKSSRSSQKDDNLTVLTTFYPVYEFTKAVLGQEGNVSMMIPSGTDSHQFEPSTKDMVSIQNADAFVYMDDNMETWVPKIKKASQKSDVTFIKGTSGMLLLSGGDHDEEGEHEGHHHDLDPHVWLSPKRSITVVKTIRNQLSKTYPKKADTFTKNANRYIRKLKSLDQDYQSELSNAKQDHFVTQHTAFSYLALDYGLTQVPITGLSTNSEVSSKRLSQLSHYINQYDIPYIYVENSQSNKLAKALAKETGVQIEKLDPIEGIQKKDLKEGKTYLSIMKDNLRALKRTTDHSGKAILPEKDQSKTVENGYFKTENVSDRSLKDWSGNWQSVYPYLKDGTLNEVWQYKAKLNKDKTASAYKDYYQMGYKTDVEKILINGAKNQVTFIKKGKKQTFTYTYSGYKILTYSKGNRGVRYLFETKDKNAGEFKFIQFSDHAIKSQSAEHFHLFLGADSHNTLFNEMDNWPTYYPNHLSGKEIAQEIIAH